MCIAVDGPDDGTAIASNAVGHIFVAAIASSDR